jgi:FixJ family two-component response regulator
MRGPKPAHPIVLTAEDVRKLQQLIRAHSTPQTLAVRARIILTANVHPEQNNQQIAAVVGTTERTVRSWRARWITTRLLVDAPRSGAPRRFSPSGASTSHRHRL